MSDPSELRHVWRLQRASIADLGELGDPIRREVAKPRRSEQDGELRHDMYRSTSATIAARWCLCLRCGLPAGKGNDWCRACEDANAADVIAAMRASGENGNDS